jgi:hypothetical protein
MKTETSIPLHYAKAPSPWPRRVRRILLGLLLAAAGWACWRFGRYAWNQARVLYWQRQCMNFALPRGTVVYEEEPTAAARLLKSAEYSSYPLRRSPGPSPATPVQAASLVPSCWRSLTASAKLPTTSFLFVGRLSGKGAPAIIFLHQRISPGGHRRLICVSYAPDTDTFQPAFIRSYDYDTYTATPATWTRPMGVPPMYGDGFDVKSGYPRHAPLVRVYAGQPDADDPAHFTVRYQMWGQEDVLDGRLQDDDEVTLTPRHLPDWPGN